MTSETFSQVAIGTETGRVPIKKRASFQGSKNKFPSAKVQVCTKHSRVRDGLKAEILELSGKVEMPVFL